MTLKELEAQILALSAVDKVEILQLLIQSLSGSSSGITKIPGVCGGDACIAGTRIPVWLLVSLRRQGSDDAELLKFYPSLNAVDLVNAWAYANAYAAEIEKALQQEIDVT